MMKLTRHVHLAIIACLTLIAQWQTGCQSVQNHSAVNRAAAQRAKESDVSDQMGNLPALRRQRREAIQNDVTRKLEEARSRYRYLGDS
ncbi:MAG: hypothetical protein ACUVQR_09700 [Thermogutta sp.]